MASIGSFVPFASATDAIVFYLVVLGWFLAEVFGPRLSARRSQGGTLRKRGDRGSGSVIRIGLYLTIAAAFGLAYAGVGGLPHALFYVGIAAMILGIAVRQWAIAVLGAYFSRSIRVLTVHRVVRTGPYRYVRHPSYTGAILTLVGLGLALTSMGATLVILAGAGLVYGYRIRVEETFLRRELGAEYVAYSKETKRLLPFLL